MTLTPLINSFNPEAGDVFIVIETRLGTEFEVAEPKLSTTGLNPSSLNTGTNLLELARRRGIDFTAITLAIDGKKYPKYRPNSYFAEIFDGFKTLGERWAVYSNSSFTSTGTTLVGWSLPAFHKNQGVLKGSGRNCRLGLMDIEENTDPEVGYKYWPNLRRATLPFTSEQMTSLYAEYPGASESDPTGHYLINMEQQINYDSNGRMHTHFGPVIYIADEAEVDDFIFEGRVGVKLPSSLGSSVVAEMTVGSEVDTKQLPLNYATIDFINVDHPAILSGLAASGNNNLMTSEFTQFLWNYALDNCPSGGQLNFSLHDPSFNVTLFQFMFRTDIGFATTVPANQTYSYFNGNIDQYTLSVDVLNTQVLTPQQNDFSNFNSIVASAERKQDKASCQMFALTAGMGALSGLFGGIASAASNKQKYKHEEYMTQLNNLGNFLTNTTSTFGGGYINGAWNNYTTLQNTAMNNQAQMQRQQQQQDFQTRGSNFFHSPAGTVASHQGLEPNQSFLHNSPYSQVGSQQQQGEQEQQQRNQR